MRFITRTLPWVVILVVIAFFIGLKQSSNRSTASTASSVEKKVTKADVSSEDSTSKASSTIDSKTSDAKPAATANEQETVIILEESSTTKEEPSSSTTEEKPSTQDKEKPKASSKPVEGEPDPSDGDLIEIKLFEGAVEKEDPNQPTKASKANLPALEGPANSTTPEESSPTQKESPEAKTTSLIGSPILLSMNPPVLRQPIINGSSDSKSSSSEGWAWSEAVEKVQSESSDSQTDNSSNDASQGKMPTMYGPADEDVIEAEDGVIEEGVIEEGATEEETTNSVIEEESTDDSEVEGDNSTENEDEESESTTPADQPIKQSPKQEDTTPTEPLSPEMQKLRDNVRQTISAYSQPILNTRDNTVAQLLDVCEAFGCDAEVMYVDQKRKINAFANLCYNYPCAGYQPLKVSNGQIEPRLGYGFQEKPGQMLAVMALSRVPESYPIQVSEKITGTVADLVQREKETCRSGEDLSFKLIGIMRYTQSGEKWKSESGQTWTVERLLREVLKQPAQIDNVAGTNRLMALSYAVERRAQSGMPINGTYAKAAQYIAEFQDYALSMINSDGTWHPQFFMSRGSGNSGEDRLQSTGHILRWLVFSLPEERLQDPRVIKAISQVYRSLGGNARNGLASSSPQAIDSRLTAVHALVLYNHRLFKPYDEVATVETAENVKENAK